MVDCKRPKIIPLGVPPLGGGQDEFPRGGCGAGGAALEPQSFLEIIRNGAAE